MIVKLKFESGNIVDTAALERLQYIVGESIETEKVFMDSNGTLKVKDYRYDGEAFVDGKFGIDSYKEYVCDMDLIMEEFPNLNFTFKPIRRAAASVKHIVDKHDQQLTGMQTINYNEKCEISVPGLGLLHYNRVALIEDSCTDVLQDMLSSGWRIIAACPQPDQRRPDYILGKYDLGIERGDTHMPREAYRP